MAKFQEGDKVKPTEDTLLKLRERASDHDAGILEIDAALGSMPWTVKEYIKDEYQRLNIYTFKGIDTFCLYEFEIEPASRFKIGDEVQLTAGSVEFYENETFDELDFSSEDIDWSEPGRVIHVTASKEDETALITLDNLPFSFYDFELEFSDMRRGHENS